MQPAQNTRRLEHAHCIKYIHHSCFRTLISTLRPASTPWRPEARGKVMVGGRLSWVPFEEQLPEVAHSKEGLEASSLDTHKPVAEIK